MVSGAVGRSSIELQASRSPISNRYKVETEFGVRYRKQRTCLRSNRYKIALIFLHFLRCEPLGLRFKCSAGAFSPASLPRANRRGLIISNRQCCRLEMGLTPLASTKRSFLIDSDSGSESRQKRTKSEVGRAGFKPRRKSCSPSGVSTPEAGSS